MLFPGSVIRNHVGVLSSEMTSAAGGAVTPGGLGGGGT